MVEPSVWDVLECITEEMDLVYGATDYPWRLRICSATYRLLKEFDANGRPEWLGEKFYQRDGHEYIRAVQNENIPFILHYRIVLDESLAGAANYGTAVELDDVIEPSVRERSDCAWKDMQAERWTPQIMPPPFPQSFWMGDGLCAGSYPGDLDAAVRDAKLRGLLDCGIRRVISLMEVGETSRGGRPFEPYEPRLQGLAAEAGLAIEFVRMSIRDASSPTRAVLDTVLDKLDESLELGIPTYLHCWGGHGRTSTVAACHLIRHGSTPEQAIAQVFLWREGLPKNHHPFEGDQERFVRSWQADS